MTLESSRCSSASLQIRPEARFPPLRGGDSSRTTSVMGLDWHECCTVLLKQS